MTRSDLRAGSLARVGSVMALVLIVIIVVLGFRRFNYCVPQDATWLRDTPIAHRGLHTSKFDENSLGAFTNAISSGYGIELDVRLTKDRVPVVIHDNNLGRLLGLDNSVSKMLLTDLKELKLLASGEQISTLSEALMHINGQVPVLVEMKNFGLPGDFEMRVLSVLKDYDGEYALQSFNPLVCRWLRKHDKDLVVGLLLDDIPVLRFRHLRNFKDNVFSAICSPGFVTYNYGAMNAEIARGYRDSGVTVLGYGLDENALVDKAYLRYVDNVIFDLSN